MQTMTGLPAAIESLKGDRALVEAVMEIAKRYTEMRDFLQVMREAGVRYGGYSKDVAYCTQLADMFDTLETALDTMQGDAETIIAQWDDLLAGHDIITQQEANRDMMACAERILALVVER